MAPCPSTPPLASSCPPRDTCRHPSRWKLMILCHVIYHCYFISFSVVSPRKFSKILFHLKTFINQLQLFTSQLGPFALGSTFPGQHPSHYPRPSVGKDWRGHHSPHHWWPHGPRVQPSVKLLKHQLKGQPKRSGRQFQLEKGSMMYVKNRLFKSEIFKNHKRTLQNTSSSKMPFECQTIHDQFLHYCWVLESVQSRNASRWPHCRRCLGPWALQRIAARHHSHLQTLVRRSVFQRFALAKKWMDSPSNQQKVFFGRFWQGVHNFDEYVYKYIYIPVNINIYIYTCKYKYIYIPVNINIYIYTCKYKYIYTCKYIYIYIPVYIYTYMYIPLNFYVYIYISYICVCMRLRFKFQFSMVKLPFENACSWR